jgi:hypothetical protein
MSNVIYSNKFKKLNSDNSLDSYIVKLKTMDKSDLMGELLVFHDKIKNKELDLVTAQQGVHLMATIRDTARTPGLQALANKYYEKLLKIQEQLEKGSK